MAAGATYTPIATTTLVSAQASVTFSSISGSYTDLVLISNTGIASGVDKGIYMTVGNGSVDTGNNYSNTFFYSDGSGSNYTSTRTDINYANTMRTSNSLIASGVVHLMNYSNTTTYKTIFTKGNNTNGILVALINLWRSTSAINIITMVSEDGSNFLAGSTFTLYGIAAA